MGWLAVALLAAFSFLALWRIGRAPRATLEAIGAALLLGLAGYALMGSPEQPGAPKPPRERSGEVDPALVEQRRQMMGRFGNEAQVFDFADTLSRFGQTRGAVNLFANALRKSPNDPELWVGLGNALVNHADGMMSPAAQFAFTRAAQISPEHPAPPFFLGLALAQSGQGERAARIWSQLLARAPADASWRDELELRLAQLGMAVNIPPPVEDQSVDAAAGSNAVGPTAPIANSAGG